MSGRSGYVRVKQASRSHLNCQKQAQPQAPKNQTIFSTPELAASTSFYPSDTKSESNLYYIENNATFSQDLHIQRGMVQSPSLPNHLMSKVERSQFRTKMDEKSIKCRNEIRRAFRLKRNKNSNENRATPEESQFNLKKDRGRLHETLILANKIPVSESKLQNCHNCHQDYSTTTTTSSNPLQLKRWIGDGRLAEPWAKLRKDPELFDSFGDTLVYFCDAEINFPYPPPSLRINSHFIEVTNSIILIKMLREGCTEDDFRSYQKTYKSTRILSSSQSNHYDGQISYQIFFPVPQVLSNVESQRHQVATRNMFALILNASLVGQTIYQALYDLRDRVEEYMPVDTDSAGMIIDWIKGRSIDDPRNNLSTALSLLAWSEGDCVHWAEGWKEAFSHAVGLRALDPDRKIELIPEYCYLSPITKTLLERYSLDIQLLVRGCECRLSTFDLSDMWDIVNQKNSTGRSAFDRLRVFFVQHYQKIFGTWPPSMRKERWLTRSVAKILSKDFGALYDYLVNRTISWDCEEERAGRKWNMKCATNQSFNPDTLEIPVTDILISFDNRMEYPHIPHPYCLTPDPNLAWSNSKNLKKAGKKTRQQEYIMQERQAVIAYQNSTNIFILGSDFVSNDLVDAFAKFEHEEFLIDGDLYNGRRGRWILIYGILQVLASISVDTPQLRYIDNVDYHLQCSLRGTPPWFGADQNQPEAKHTNSHCWLAPDRWRSLQPVTIRPRSDPSSKFSLTNRTPNSQSNRESSYRFSTDSYVLNDLETSLRSPTLTSISCSSPLASRNPKFSYSPIVCRDMVVERASYGHSRMSHDQFSVSPTQKIDTDPFISNVDNLVMEPFSLRSSHLHQNE